MKRYSILVITLLFFTLFFSCQEGEILKSSLNQTSESFLPTNYDSVIFYADENLKQNLGNSQDYYSYYLRAYAYSKLKDYRRSSDDYLKALEVIPEDKQIMLTDIKS